MRMNSARTTPPPPAQGPRPFQTLDRRLDRVLPVVVLIAVAAALLTLLAGCGGSDDPVAPTPAGNGALTAQQIADAQAALDRSNASVDAGSALTAVQIQAQRAALDGATTDGVETIVSNQQALDTDADLIPTF